MTSLVGDKKQALRRAALKRRESLRPCQIGSWGEQIQARVLGHSGYVSARAVALYSPIGNEAPTHWIRDHALAEGKLVFYPKLGDATEPLVRIESATDLLPGKHGIREPGGHCYLSEECRTGLIVFVPAVLVDAAGNRLGRGAGWYDRKLTSLGGEVVRIALAYDFQLIEEVPTEEWDCPVDLIITEERVIRCR